MLTDDEKAIVLNYALQGQLNDYKDLWEFLSKLGATPRSNKAQEIMLFLSNLSSATFAMYAEMLLLLPIKAYENK